MTNNLVRWLVLAAAAYSAFLYTANKRMQNNGWIDGAVAFCLLALLEPFSQKYLLLGFKILFFNFMKYTYILFSFFKLFFIKLIHNLFYYIFIKAIYNLMLL